MDILKKINNALNEGNFVRNLELELSDLVKDHFDSTNYFIDKKASSIIVKFKPKAKTRIKVDPSIMEGKAANFIHELKGNIGGSYSVLRITKASIEIKFRG